MILEREATGVRNRGCLAGGNAKGVTFDGDRPAALSGELFNVGLRNARNRQTAFAQRACRDHPGYSIRAFERSFPHKVESHRALMARGLRGAGVPDDVA